MKRIALKTILKITSITVFTLLLFAFASYKWCIPALISNPVIINFAQKEAGKILNADVTIQNPKLKTGGTISFTVDKFAIDKNNRNYLTLADIDILLSLRDLYKRRIIVRKVLAKDVFADVYNLSGLFPQKEQKKESESSFITFDMYNILLGVKNCRILYDNPDFKVDFTAKHAVFDRTQARKFLHFDFDLMLEKDGHQISVSANDQNRIFMDDGVAYIKDFPISIEDSNIVINAFLTRKKEYELRISAQNFNADDIADIVSSNLIVANGRQMLEPVKNIKGSVNFDVKFVKNVLNGTVSINDVYLEVKPLLNMPVRITKGNVLIGDKDIKLDDFEGYYNNKKTNTLSMKGDVKDYQHTCDTVLFSDIFVTNDFFKNYLSKMLGSPIQLVGDSMSKLLIKSKNGSLDILWFFLLKENHGFKFGEQSMVLKDYKTFFKVDLSIIKNILKINTINYHITKELKRGMTPLVQIDGNIDMADNMKILDLNINMPRELPSEFLNFLACQKIFKKGYVSGKMHMDNHGDYAKLDGNFKFDKVLVPAQRMYIKSAELFAKDDKIILKSNGRYKRTSYSLNGHADNKLLLPIMVRDVNLTLDDVDVERFLVQQQQTAGEEVQDAKSALVSKGTENEEDEPLKFTKGLVVVEKCGLNLIKGKYKEINFGNLHADMTLDKDGVLNLKSNRFDIAEGFSTLRTRADLVNNKYYLKLGIKDVDSDKIASAMLGLPRQISGKAKGLIEINTDETFRLNGNIKFKINNGTIEQVGYVEYILNVASLFRNPLAMISPTTIFDMVNIPEGRFNEIQGEMQLEDNVIKRMKIESSADELATFIIGRYDLSTNDASLRIYTKFSGKSKGFAGFLRNFSLNTLATKISISARNDSNYYANELSMIPKLKNGEEKAQVFITKVDGDVINYNFLSSLKRIK